VEAMSSCNVTENTCAISPANAAGSVFQESCNAGSAGAPALSPRLAHSSTGSGTCTIKRSCNAGALRRLPPPIPGMDSAPSLRAGHVHGAAEVLAVLGLGQPGGLTRRLACAPTSAGRAVPLPLAVAMVRIEKQPATQALALPRLRHRRSPTGSSRTAPSATRTPQGAV
jgi:hypothetical protein